MTDIAAPPAPPVVKTFADFGVDPAICASLADAGIIHPFPIQELTLHLAIQGADLIGQARTGTGKTLAFGIPLLQRAATNAEAPGPRALVIVPTRELCLQVRDDLAAAGARHGSKVLAVYGGKSLEAQVEALQQGVDIVVGTPGRLLDLMRRGSLVLSGVTGLVLDEADEMLDLGFLPDVEQLIQATAPQRQTLLFSATMPSAVVALARRYMNKPTFMRADVEEVRIGPDTAQHFFSCHRMDKPAVLARILKTPERGLCVVFSRTKRMADMLVEDLRSQDVNAAAIHSDLRQDARERALKAFRSGKIDVLVATEVAARGLDISDVTHVVNYDCPDDEKMYLHRIGRTGRAGAAGVAITLAVWNELARLEMIKKALGITEPTHEVFSTSEILDELFDLPPREARPTAKSSSSRRPARADTDATAATPAAGSDQDDDATAARPRRSRGGRGRKSGARGASPAAEPETAVVADDVVRDTRAGETGEPGTDDQQQRPKSATSADADADVIRRVRTRRRAGDDPGVTPRPPAAPPSPAADRPARDRVAADNDEGTTRRRTRTPEGRRRDKPAETPEPTGRDSARRRPERPRPARPDRRRDGTRRPAARPATDVDSDVARGTGRPRLARAMVISYLP